MCFSCTFILKFVPFYNNYTEVQRLLDTEGSIYLPAVCLNIANTLS